MLLFWIIAGIVFTWLGIGFVARCICKYRRVSRYIRVARQHKPELQLNILDSAVQRICWRWHNEFVAFLYFLAGPVGLMAALTYAAMEPGESDQKNIGILL